MFGLFKSEKEKTKSRLKSYKFPRYFRDKLAREQRWSNWQVDKEISDYLKFCYLAKYHAPVTPSKTVDEVWHLHLDYESSYKDFCENYLKFNLVHIPGNGSIEDEIKHKKQYESTNEAYQSNFATDSMIWGSFDSSPSSPSTTESSFGGGHFGGSGAGSDWGGSGDSGHSSGGDSGGHSSCSSSSCGSSCGSGCGGGD